MAAFLLDGVLARWTIPHYRFVRNESTIARAVKELGAFRVTLGAVVLLCIFHPRHWRAGALVLASAGLGGLIEVSLKWAVGRSRPLRGQILSIDPYRFEFFRGGLAGYLKQSNLCFPSGHATCAFAVAACLAHLLPRWKFLWFALASLVAIERVAELAHYPSDVVAGAIVGILSFHLVRRLFEKFDPARRSAGLSHSESGSA